MNIYIALIMALISTPLLAGFAPDTTELKSLPQYCTPRILQNDPAGWAAGTAQYGEGWGHMHHYCYALNFINRYYRARDAAAKRDALNQAVGNLDYMLTHTSETYFMRGQFMLDKGRAMILQGNKPRGLVEVQRALSFAPELEAGYRYIADYYRDMGKKGEALKWVTTGLKHIPESGALQRRYKDMGGKEPFPEPLSKPAPPVAQVPQKQGGENNTDTTVIQNPTQVETTPEIVAPKIGTPKNPYCRFCPN